MGNNRFLTVGDEGAGELPKRVYAKVDQIDSNSVLLDAIHADWFDDIFSDESSFGRFTERASEAPIFVYRFKMKRMMRLLALGQITASKLLNVNDETESRSWLELMFGGHGIAGTVYQNLFGEGIPISASNIKIADPSVAAQLDAAFSLDEHVASEAELNHALQSITRDIEWVGVYDVGQGGANGLCDASGMPLAYFDMGGGVIQNTHTFSTMLKNFCFTNAPPVILSHWDWDHWSSGNRFPQAHRLDWIVPNQILGAVHATFAASIVNQGKLLVWPNNLASISSHNQITIFKCAGNGRNQSGLAVEVAGPNQEDPILLTGDARYNVIPGAAAKAYSSVVVPHHGADMKNQVVPRCPGYTYSRAAYSYGASNSFGHPRRVTEANHDRQSWWHSYNSRSNPMDRNTRALRPQQLGHIGLTWVANRTVPILPCLGSCCSLQFTQT